jgi:sterol 3beta-glucosyltransferase/vancomycin aglycone glucosyltransferase
VRLFRRTEFESFHMRIGLQTWGTAGDVRPFIALARGLAEAGHEVTLALSHIENADYTGWAEDGGFRLEKVGRTDGNAAVLGEVYRQILGKRNGISQLQIVMRSYLDPIEEALEEASQRLCRANDLVIGHALVHSLPAAAEAFRTPYIRVTLQTNGAESRFLPPSSVPDMGPWLNPLSWRLAGWVMDGLLKQRFNRSRARLGLPPIAHVLDTQDPRHPCLHAYSPIFQPLPKDWSRLHCICGFLDLSAADDDLPIPEELDEFLRAGEPPVFLGFGSMDTMQQSTELGLESLRLMADAARKAGCRAIVQSQAPPPPDVAADPRIHVLKAVSHRAVFPRCAAVVHHGGAGTAHAAAKAGRPSVVVIHALDQFLWAVRLKELGVAPRPLSRRTLTSDKLARSIRQVLGRPELRERARAIGDAMKAENGVARAVEAISQWCAGPDAHPLAGHSGRIRDLPGGTSRATGSR